MRQAILIAVISLPCWGQAVSIGVKGGVRANDYMDSTLDVRDESKRWVVGPSVEVGLPKNLSLQVEALYRRTGYSSDFVDIVSSTYHSRFRGYTWDIPMLAKYSFLKPEATWRPFVNGGYAGRVRCNCETAYYNVIRNPVVPGQFQVQEGTLDGESSWDNGVAVGGGVERKWGRMKWTGEFRYTRWNNDQETTFYKGQYTQLSKNQYDVLFGVRW